RYFHLFQLDSASAYFLEALQLRPDNQDIIGTLAAIENARRIQAEQEEQLREAEVERRQTLASFLTEAEGLLGKRSYSAAEDLVELVLDTDPTNVSANLLKQRIQEARTEDIAVSLRAGHGAAAKQDYIPAVEAFNRVLELDPTNVEATNARQDVLAAMDLTQKIQLGIELFDKGRFDEAGARFRAILQVKANEPTAMDYLQRIEQAQTRTVTLEELQKDDEMWDLYVEGLRYYRNKEYAKAIEVWDKVLKKYPNNPSTLDNIQQARLRLGAQDKQ
ncbi:MAG: tetratricopeptide repeat protein, partial [candidate division Zixibacteria bacterium]|nr:tetratricopeptide repeat protein [candidate division Zixibacteria bacterium]